MAKKAKRGRPAKFDKDDVKSIRSLYKAGKATLLDLSDRFETSLPTITDVIHKRGAYAY